VNTPIRAAYRNALLADASYVEGLEAGATGPELANALVRSDRFTEDLASAVGAEFRVVTQFTDPSGSGLSVTVFIDSAGGNYISVRGTEVADPADVVADLDTYLGSGLARRQVIALANWYLRANTPADGQVVQMLETPAVDQVTGEMTARTVVVQGEGTLPVAGSYIVNGHSLGGHLTTVFSRLFNSRVISSHTYNGLGVGHSFPESFITEIEAALGLGATSWETVDAKQTNYYA
jgi:hypothetical protein